MDYQIDKPFRVGETTQVQLKGCPPDYVVDVSVKYGNATVTPTDSTLFSVTVQDDAPIQLYISCCPLSRSI